MLKLTLLLVVIFGMSLFVDYYDGLFSTDFAVCPAGGLPGSPDSPAPRKRREMLVFLCVLLTLIFFSGLRTAFNDTGTYIRGFNSTEPFIYTIRNLDWSPGKNPAFVIINSIIKTFTNDPQIFLMFYSVLTLSLIVPFLRKYSPSFCLIMFIFICGGYYCFTLAAIKQCVATAIAMWSVHFALKKNWVMFVAVIFIALWFHPYAILFAVVPFLICKPWTTRTWLIIIAGVIGAVAFDLIINLILGVTSMIGESEYSEELFTGEGVNILRFAVYTVPTVLSLLFRHELYEDSTPAQNLIMNLAVLSNIIMFVGLFGTANMFARLANYFELFVYLALVDIVFRIKDKIKPFIFYCFFICYYAYLFYTYAIMFDFNYLYKSIALIDFVRKLIT